MEIRRHYKLIISFGVFVVVVFLAVALKPGIGSVFLDIFEKIDFPHRQKSMAFLNLAKPNDGFIDSNFYELRDLIEKSVVRSEAEYQNRYSGGISDKYIQAGITSHHLPEAVSLISDLYTHFVFNKGPRDIFVIVGPDHFERGYTSVSTTLYPYITPFGKLEAEQDIIGELIKTGVNIDNGALKNEHSIGSQAVFTKLFFPNARIVPLIFRADTDERIINDIAKVLARYKERIILVASIDFSHYQPYQYARMLDNESKKLLVGLNFDSFSLEYADSPPSLQFLGRLFDCLEMEKIDILDVANSYDFNGNADSTTGYINALLSKRYSGNNSDSQTLMFVGDIMLSRAVGSKMERERNWKWPFLDVADYLQKADLLFGNLEGAVSDKGIDIGGIYSFRADPRVMEGLKYAGFDVLSVANNHTDDWGRDAMEDTFANLKKSGIKYIGGGYSEMEAHLPIVKKLNNGTRVAFLAYTNIGSKYWTAKDNQSGLAWLEKEEMEKDIEKAKLQADIVVISMHFGTEYITRSNSDQQFFARAAIDAGADLVIGHHPHVVQEIEEYKDGYIAYSLGNFIFDQNFSKNTTRGLILEVIVDNKSIKEAKSVDIKISNSYQAEVVPE